MLINTFPTVIVPATYTSPGKYTEMKVNGLESDLIQLRLAAMNMVLHGIKNPKILFTPSENHVVKENPTLIISNLLFSNNNTANSENHPESGKLEKENIILKEILDNLKQGGRAVVLVPQMLLSSENPAIVKTRKTMVDHYNLQAVITLSPKNDSLFSEACVLVF